MDNKQTIEKAKRILNQPLNYRDLTKKLDLEYVCSSSKAKQIKVLSSLMEIKITRHPTRYTVVRIYDEQKAIYNKNCNPNLKAEFLEFCEQHFIEVVGELPATLRLCDEIDFKCKFHPDIMQHSTVNKIMISIGCPLCTYPMGRFEVMLYLGLKDSGAVHREKIDGIEYDIVLPKEKIAIEVDGAVFHSGEHEIDREQKKYEIAEKNGYRLIKIYESKVQSKVNPHKDGDRIYIPAYQQANREIKNKIITLIQSFFPYKHSESLWHDAAIYMREWKNQVYEANVIRQYDIDGNLIAEYKNFDEIKNAIARGEAFGFKWEVS